jgi:hypothetical protein
MRKFLKSILRYTFVAFLVSLLIFFVGVLWPSAPLPGPPSPTSTLAITNVTVVDVAAGASRPGRTVLIDQGRIRFVAAVDSVRIDTAAVRIDGTGKYLIPGLWDMHAHLIRHSPQLHYPLFIAHGVTGIREMGFASPQACREGSNPMFICPPDRDAWNGRVVRGEMVGPLIQAAAIFQIEGPDDLGLDPDSMSTPAAAAQLRQAVRALRARGIDFIKLTMEEELPLELYHVLMEEARAVGLPVTGHLPRPLSAAEAARRGFRSVEHARVFVNECFPRAEPYRRREIKGSAQLWLEMVAQHDTAACGRIYRAFAEHETWFDPTHITRRWEALLDDPAYRADPRLGEVPWFHRMVWNFDGFMVRRADPTPTGRRAFREFYTKGLEATGDAHRAGVRILAGSDALDAHAFYGSGLHDELAELVKAGLTPAEALRAATLSPAEFLWMDSEYGTVDVGKQADLVLLDADPLRDIAHTRRIAAVIHHGRLYDRARLDALQMSVEDAAAGWTTSAKLMWRMIRFAVSE